MAVVEVVVTLLFVVAEVGGHNAVLGCCGEVGRGGGGEGEVIVFNDMAIVVDKSVRGGEHGRK